MLAAAILALSFSPPAAQLQNAALDTLIAKAAAYFNVSLSAAFTTSLGKTYAAAGGPSDRTEGKVATASSQFPGGSVTKTFTSVAALKLAETGALKLDEPVHLLVDPWLKKQGHKSLRELWGGDETINAVTARQLLQMRGGIADYDDGWLRQWTVAHPSQDWLPLDFVQNVSKTFLFRPGEGGAYSGVSYVLMCWVLSAATGGADWTALRQAALIEERSDFKFEATRFLGTGPCSQYPGLVHQYLYGTYRMLARPPATLATLATGAAGAAGAAEPLAPAAGGAVEAAPSHCGASGRASHVYYPETVLQGRVVGQTPIATGGAAACCAAGDLHEPPAQYWSFVGEGSASGRGTCYYYSEASGGSHQANAASGRTDTRLSASEFTDLYGASCLNGWTMGNIATTPSELTRFYHATFVAGGVLGPASLAAMQAWQPLTDGFNSGAPYGLGLFRQQLRIPLKGHSCDGASAAVCKCHLLLGCAFEATTVGHPGLDYGSGFPLIGTISELNVSYALGSNTGESPIGMNFTLGALENARMMSALYCPLIEAAVHAQVPGFPAFNCGESSF